MCAALHYMALTLAIQQVQLQTNLQMPTLDHHGRRQTMNFRGYADTQLNPFQRKAIRRAMQRAGHRDREFVNANWRQPSILVVGDAFGDFSVELIRRGVSVLYNDMDPRHAELATIEMQKARQYSSQFQTFVAELPFRPEQEDQIRAELDSYLRMFEITDVVATQMSMYLSGPDFVRLLKWWYELLPPGGRVYMTATSPYTPLLGGIEQLHQKRFERFWETFGRVDPFPGWIPNVFEEPEVQVPSWYRGNYPEFFHFYHPQVVQHHAKEVGFAVPDKNVGFMRRPFPEHLTYQGTDPNVGELTFGILEKPLKPHIRRTRRPK